LAALPIENGTTTGEPLPFVASMVADRLIALDGMHHSPVVGIVVSEKA
jgi:hypothetical protein